MSVTLPTPAREGRRCLALVELLFGNGSRQCNNELYPFWQGFCHRRGLESPWTRIAVARTWAASELFIARLEPADEDALFALLAEARPTHLLVNLQLEAALRARLGAAFADCDVLELGGRRPDSTALTTVASLRDFLRCARDDGDANDAALLVDAEQPSYDAHELGASGDSFARAWHIQCGPQCLYRHALAKNPLFAGLELSSASAPWGCSFCGSREDLAPHARTAPLELARRQLTAFAQSSAAGTPRPALFFCGALAFYRLDELFADVARLPLPPCDFHFAPRVDALLRMATKLEALLPHLEQAGHRLRLLPMGVENFSLAENQRFNKDLAPRQVEAAYLLMRRLERAFPSAFAPSFGNRFGFILFTPWTTLADLHVNLEWASKIELDPDGRFLGSRLQLSAGQALTLLAERDGLCGPSRSGVSFALPAVTSYLAEDLPWHFRDARAALAFGLLSRIPRRVEGTIDPIYDRLQALRIGLGEPSEARLRLAREVVTLLTDLDLGTVDEVLLALERRVDPASKIRTAATPLTRARQRATTDVPQPTGTRLVRLIEETVAALNLAAGQAPGVKAIASVRERGGTVLVSLSTPTGALELYVEARATVTRFYAHTECYAVSYLSETPPDTVPKQRALDDFVQRLREHERQGGLSLDEGQVDEA